MSDLSSAKQLADTITNYWKSKGYSKVKVWVCMDFDMGIPYLKSNIIHKGFPPR